MPSLYTNEEEKQSLLRIFTRRRIKRPLMGLIKIANQKSKGKYRCKTSSSYPSLLQLLDDAVTDGMITNLQIAQILDESELAGNQHILLFCAIQPDKKCIQSIFDQVSNPSGKLGGPLSVAHFLSIPNTSTYRFVKKDDNEIVVKITASREFWVKNVLPCDDPDKIIQELVRKRERFPLIIKVSIDRGLVQIRVPSGEKGGLDSPRNYFQVAERVIKAHYDTSGTESWFRKIKNVPIANAFNALVSNDQTLVSMWSDTPENRRIVANIKNKGRPREGHDLRDDEDWNHSDGYARKIISGYFRAGDDKLIFARLADDRLQLKQGMSRNLSRLFVTRYHDDGDIEYVISRILASIP